MDLDTVEVLRNASAVVHPDTRSFITIRKYAIDLGRLTLTVNENGIYVDGNIALNNLNSSSTAASLFQ